MAMTLGGRAAEEIVFGEVTTGASNDLEKVTATAKQMVMRFGMSEKLGPRVFGHDHGMPFLGREFSAEPDYSDEIAREIDDEIRRIVEAAHVQAKDILTQYRRSLEKLSENHRSVLVLREIEGLAYKEIAEAMGCSIGTVMSRLFHARTKVQKILSEYLELEEHKSGVGNE